MKRIIKVCVLSVMLVLFYSCANDKSNDAKLLRKLIETVEDSSKVTTVLTYKDNEIVSTDNSNEHVDYTYTDGLITTIVSKKKSDQSLVSTSFTYDKGKLVQAKSSDGSETNYTHSADGSVTYEHFASNDKEGLIKQFHGVLTFEEGNLVKDNRVLDNSEVNLITKIDASYEYDTKNNPWFNIKAFDKLLIYNELISVNNSMLSVIENNTTNTKEDQIISSAKMHKSIFKYDSDDYPKEQISENAKSNSGYLKSEYIYE
ncbi:hypothetical protein H8R23_00700 [Flavobacterium sp. F-380]|uniref:YD repeat-containing protein n=1 Tax=Flavobacterium kayseriense TaxID=2764714 RepID=A0ABR7J2X3_9FLAO|nr:hypothetical protein [Flavobacterium kayseriense]MBC5839914.1 hypothetical protein [Flavobacterium kayseriense]MBC5847416.1 hypothetical protein [Flavobacterium kayseriense]MBU0940118.1 hypothetical protein [Bacteroidota bacterium]